MKSRLKTDDYLFNRSEELNVGGESKQSKIKQICSRWLGRLTLSWPGKILLRPKIRCFNFKPQYLLNYTSPTNDLYSVRKRSIGAFKSIFKLLGLGPASAGPLRAKFFARSSPLACGFAALAPNFAPKLCTPRVSACFSTCFKTCWGRFDPMLIPVG